MISFLILLLLAWNFYIGYHRGIILQAYYFAASLISLGIAAVYYKQLAELLTLWVPYSNASEGASVTFFSSVGLFELDKVFYAGLSFFSLYVLAYLIFRLLGIFVHFVRLDRFDKPVFAYISGGLAVLVSMLSFNLFFSILAAVPVTAVQNFLAGSAVIRLLINFPLFSWIVNHFWIAAVLK
ncbi:CvpA family protein [Streptococcus caviae]|uniref:CvpA family protein n=1 Tax=Streptococcus sp. 'caviae' TaxID=1915004 RepID=UPI00094B80A7|nr:CvpA family protein [Streptococcus sp. 'caviae']OLN83194.1 colicin V production protein [Streptococcus sp. 'caviae']